MTINVPRCFPLVIHDKDIIMHDTRISHVATSCVQESEYTVFLKALLHNVIFMQLELACKDVE